MTRGAMASAEPQAIPGPSRKREITAAGGRRRNDADGGATRTPERRGRQCDASGRATRAAARRGRRDDVGGDGQTRSTGTQETRFHARAP
jgi:hypothetical protein